MSEECENCKKLKAEVCEMDAAYREASDVRGILVASHTRASKRLSESMADILGKEPADFMMRVVVLSDDEWKEWSDENIIAPIRKLQSIAER